MEVSDTRTAPIVGETRDTSVSSLVGALQGLYRAYHNMAIYPSGHPSVPRSIEIAAKSFDRLLADRPSLVVNVASNQLLSDEMTISEGNDTLRSLAGLLHDLDVAAVEFHAGLASSELASLVERLAEARKASVKGATLAREIAAELEHLRLCPIDYRALSFGEGSRSTEELSNIWEKLSRSLTDPAYYASGADVEHVADAVAERIVQFEGTGVGGLRTTLSRQVVQLRDQPEGDQARTIRKRMAGFLNALNSDLRRDLLQVSASRPEDSLNLMTEFADTLPTGELIEALGSADRAAAQVPEELITLLNKLVRVSESRPQMATELEATLDRWGVSRDVLAASGGEMRAAMEEVFQYRAKATYNPDEYKTLLTDLSRNELSGSLTESSRLYRDPRDTADLRVHAAEIAVLLLGRTDGDAERPALFAYTGAAVDPMLRAGSYASVHDAAVAARADRMLKGKSEQTLRAAEGFLSELADEQRIRSILDGICRTGRIREEALRLLSLGGATALDQIVDRIGGGLDPAVARALCRFSMAQDAKTWGRVIEMRGERGWGALRPTFPLLKDLPREISVPLLRQLQAHESSRVRREAVSSLCQVDTEVPPEHYLRDALNDESFRVVASALRRLGRLGSPASLELLGGFLEGEFAGGAASPDTFRVAAELLLGQGDGGRDRLCDALGTLSASPRPRDARRARVVAEALGSRPTNAQVERALKRWRFSPGWVVSRFLRKR